MKTTAPISPRRSQRFASATTHYGGWATIGGEDPVALIEQFGDRIELLHVKDVADVAQRTQTTVGQSVVDWAGVFAAAQGKVRQYVIEQDPPVERFSFAAESFVYVDCLVF